MLEGPSQGRPRSWAVSPGIQMASGSVGFGGGVFHGASCARTSWAVIGASGGGLTAHPSKAATTHASPVATASAIRTSRRFSRLMGGSMLDISVTDIAGGRCAGCDQLREPDGIAGAIGHQGLGQLLTYRDCIMFTDSKSPRSAIAAPANFQLTFKPAGRLAVVVPPHSIRVSLEQLVCRQKSSKTILGGTGPVLPMRRNSQHSRARCGQIAPSRRN
jgi:hypothetical protein